MNKTKIEWCDSTWNPITGCKHGCEYCYARKIAKRFEGVWDGDNNTKMYLTSDTPKEVTGSEFDGYGLKYRVGNDSNGKPKLINAPYPYGFHPTLHRHRLESGVQQWKNPRNIFVGSMCDMFGNWVSDRWIKAVFEVCAKSPQHRYFFLTKNPKRYEQFIDIPMPNNMWFGFSQTQNKHIGFSTHPDWNVFISMEPLLEPLRKAQPEGIGWVIIGAETGNRKGKVIPKREWIENIVKECREQNIPVFMKDSLKKIWGEPLIRQYPWGGTA